MATANNFVMMALGAFRFALDTAAYQTLVRNTNYSWAAFERFRLAPLHQFTGQSSDTIQLDGTILPGFKGGLAQINLMRAQADLGLPLPLVTGRGAYLGLWVIESISEHQEVFWPDGTPRKIDFSIALKKYNEPTIKVGGFNVSASGLLAAIL